MRVIQQAQRFDLGRAIGTAIIGLLATLISGGIVALITLNVKVATLTQSVSSLSETFQKHLDHAVDRDEYLRRDSQIQRAIESMATKSEFRMMQKQMDDSSVLLRSIDEKLSRRR